MKTLGWLLVGTMYMLMERIFGIDGVLMPVLAKGPEELEIVKNKIESSGMEVYINEDDFFQPLDWKYNYE